MSRPSAARRICDRLFAAHDARARGRGWLITIQRGGAGRSYRDPRFDLLVTCTECHGTGADAHDRPCRRCPGTGRLTLDRHFSSAAR
jgi:DnaJ-class molecular chaperone